MAKLETVSAPAAALAAMLNGVAESMVILSTLNICPDCYAQRDQTIPVMRTQWDGAPRVRGRLPDGESVTSMRGGSVLFCHACKWSQVLMEDR